MSVVTVETSKRDSDDSGHTRIFEPTNVCGLYLAPIVGDQKALAFTPQQYSVAENIMGRVICS